MTAPALREPSVDEFLNTSLWDGYELDDGVPVEVPMSTLSAWVGGEMFARLRAAAQTAGGVAFPQDTPLHAWPERPRHFRKPDAMYFAPGLLGDAGAMAKPLDVGPSIAVEVISPTEPATLIETKIHEYLDAGVRLAWIVYPHTRSVHVYRPGGSAAYLGADDTLTAEDILPGFSVRVAECFRRPDDARPAARAKGRTIRRRP